MSNFSKAETETDLKNKINERNSAISKLQVEIEQYQKEIDSLGIQKNSLSNTLKSLDISKKKLEATNKITQGKISKTNLEITQLSMQIGDKKDRIITSKDVISKSFENIYQMNSVSIIESLLGQKSFSDLWKSSDEMTVLISGVQDKIKDLNNLKVGLESNKKLTEAKKAELLALTNDLKNQTKIIIGTVEEKKTLLSETKDTEANYNKILLQRLAQKEAFEREVLEFESALKNIVNTNNLPSSGSGVLSYPLSNIRVTQYFGNTEFSTKNPQIYSGKGHPGIDFAASIGTPVKSSLTGIVVGTGNTDGGGCRSYGKWVMIKHPNGLSTLYAHLSLINAFEGQKVSTGEIIGYSGNTGYSTGPHLHFGVYATEGVNITRNLGSKYCSKVKIPYASLNAYLNPLSYL